MSVVKRLEKNKIKGGRDIIIGDIHRNVQVS
jgi:hypothetical protein